MKKLFTFAVFILLTTAAFGFEFRTKAEPKPGEYVVYVSSQNWGAVTQKIVVYSLTPFFINQLDKDNFCVQNVQMFNDTNDSRHGNKKDELPIQDIFLCNAYGEPLLTTEQKSNYICISFNLNPQDESTLFLCKSLSAKSKPYYLYSITNSKIKLSCTRLTDFVFAEATDYTFKKISEGDITLEYAVYEPPKKNQKVPLIIWFHGIAEGGSNPYVSIFGTKANALSQEEVQKYFKNGAYVLYPQCPTSWLETTTKDMFGLRMWEPVDIEGPVNRFTAKASRILSSIFEDEQEQKVSASSIAKVSYYTTTCKKILDTFIAEHPDVDTSRIYAGGCSAGGYMTLNMVLQYPNFFAAAFTACEAFLDSKISDEDIEALQRIPLWFVQAKNDEVMEADTHSLATFTRIKELGAQNIHYSLFDDVHDDQFKYDGHSSWIYMMNGKCEDNGIFLFQWLSQQSLYR